MPGSTFPALIVPTGIGPPTQMTEEADVGANPIDLTQATSLWLNVYRPDATVVLSAPGTPTIAFVQPAIGQPVTAVVASSVPLSALVGASVFLAVGGQYTVTSITDPTHVVLTNSGGPANASAGASILAGGQIGVVWPGSIVSSSPPTPTLPSVLYWSHLFSVTDCPSGVVGKYAVQPMLVVPGGVVPCAARFLWVVDNQTPF